MIISIAMCTYNGADFLRDQLASITAQTRLPDEMIVCDDSSADKTALILEDFAATAPFSVHLHYNSVNLGSNRNFEKAIRLCQGEIIALSDQDDVWLPTKLAKLEAAFASDSVGLVFTNAEVVDADLKPLGSLLWDAYFPPEARHQMQAGKAFRVQLERNVVTGATMAFRAGLKDFALPIPANISLIHDGWIALTAAAVSDLVFLEEPLILYRQHPQQQLGVAAPGQKKHHILPRQHYVSHLLQLEEIERRLGKVSQSLPWHNSPAIIKIALGHRQHITAHARHLHMRLGMPAFWAFRGLFVLAQLASGQYHRYSNGIRSAARDLLYPLNAPESAEPKKRQPQR